MNLTALIIVNAVLDLAAVIAVLAIVRFTHRLRTHEAPVETIHPSQPLPLRLVLPTREVDELSRAA